MNKKSRKSVDDIISDLQKAYSKVHNLVLNEHSSILNTPNNLKNTHQYDNLKSSYSRLLNAEDDIKFAINKLNKLL